MKCKQCKREIANGSTYCSWCGKKQITNKQHGEILIPKARQLSSGKWFIQLRLNGVSIPIAAPTEKECKAQATLIKAEYWVGKREIKKDKSDLTLRQAIDSYIAARSNTLSPSTIDGYRRIQKNRFQSIADKKLSDITDWQNICNAEAKLCSPKTLRNAYRFIVSVLTESGHQAPKVTLPQIVNNGRKWLDPDQITKLVATTSGKIEEFPVMLALHSLRRSELLALNWDNIDLNDNIITVKGVVCQQ